jgi:PAS domain S-box-containing protein
MNQRELVGVWLALAILAGVAALAYSRIDSAVATLGWVEHTSQVLQQIQEMNGAYARSVSARRAFVVGGDASQLADTPELDVRMGRALAVVRRLLADNPAQVRRLDTLAELLQRRIANLDASVARRRIEGAAIETAEGLALGTSIRTAREEMEKEENNLLAERDARTRRDMRTTKIAEVAGTASSFAILLLAFRRLRQEIARRRESEQALRASEGFLDSIVENLPDMIFVKEPSELRFDRINRAGENLLGIDRTTLVGKNDYDFFPREQADFFQARDRETLANGVVVDIPEEPIQGKGGELWLHTKKVPILDHNGAPKYLLGISEDITERRKAAAALKVAKDAAESANKELEAFSYAVAHDLRAPVRTIDGFAQAIEEDCGERLGADGLDHFRRIRGAAQRMGELIDGLLRLSRVARGEIGREKVDVTRLVRQIGARLQEANPKRSVDLVVDDGLVAEGDAHLLGAAFENLLGNAWKFTAKIADPRVEVRKRVEEGRPVFVVRDNGAGFEQAYAHKLFAPFQRLHGSSEFDGTGIGLATVQRIVQRHGGRIWAEGEVGRGATFYLTL